MRRDPVGLQRRQRGPLLDDHESVGPEAGLRRRNALCVDRGPVLDAALFGQHGGAVGDEGFEQTGALAGLGGDDGNDLDHGTGSPVK
ncbi:hypothetical protein D9M69_719920 [compost metagenome]